MLNFLESIFQKIGSNFLIACFIPAMGFVTISLIALSPFLPTELRNSDWDLTQLSPIIFIALVIMMLLAFTLYNLSAYIYKAFEGQTFILAMDTMLRRYFIKRQKQRYTKLVTEIAGVSKQLDRVIHKIDNEIYTPQVGRWYAKRINRYIERRDSLQERCYTLTAYLNESFPLSPDLILPTRFGNVLRAAETYPERYSIDAVALWGRLAQIIPNNALEKINASNTQCLFALNSATLAITFAIISLVVAIYKGIIMLTIQNSSVTSLALLDGHESVYIIIYIVLAFVSAMIAWFFYEASLVSVSEYGSMIRSSYDLYRFQLLKALHMVIPDTLAEEKKLWIKISNFMVGNQDRYKEKEDDITSIMNEINDSMNFDYSHLSQDS